MTRIFELTAGFSVLAALWASSAQVATAAAIRDLAELPASCANVTAPRFNTTTASGWKVVKVAGGLTNPRGMLFDTQGRLLVVQNSKGVFAHTLGADGCLASSKQVISLTSLNHGIALSADGKTLYASGQATAWSWPYDPETATVGNSTVLVTGMYVGGTHPTRTLTLSRKNPNLLVVSHGSNGNFDYSTENAATGRACVKVFDLSKAPAGGYNYARDGYMMGYGLRNEIGITFDGNDQLWGVENSGDQFVRTLESGESADIHIDNPAEKLNLLGDVTKPNNQWYGYPTCFSVWQPSVFPDPDKKFKVGDQFVVKPNATFNDEQCVQKSTPPRLVMQPHSAPIDAAFDDGYKNMYVTFHGSWNRQPPTGFKVVAVPFKNGANGYEPVASSDSNNGYTDIWWSSDVTQCNSYSCIRPAGIVKDKQGRFYVSSDSLEGEIFLLAKA